VIDVSPKITADVGWFWRAPAVIKLSV